MKLVDEIVSIYTNFSYKTEVLVASVKTPALWILLYSEQM